MKKDFDIETLFKNIQLIKLDPAKEDACQERLKNYFATLEAKERLADKPIKTTSKPWVAYGTACVVLVCLVISSIFFYNAQMTIAKEKTRTAIQKEYHEANVFNIFINLFSRKSVVELRRKKVIFNLTTEKIIKEIYPTSILLSNEEKELALRILTKSKFVFFVLEGPNPKSSGIEYWLVTSYREIKEGYSENSQDSVLTFFTTDPIIQMEGFQYSDSKSKFVSIEVQPKEKNQKLRAFIVVNLNKRIIVGPDIEVTEVPVSSKK